MKSAMRALCPLLFAVVATLAATGVTQAASSFAWKQDRSSVGLCGAEGRVVWQFNYADTQRMPYFHPIALPDSPSLSWLTPPDHPWHYALWFAWKFLNGKNYWDFDPQTGKEEGVVRWSNVRVTTNTDHSARLELDLVYHPAESPQPVLKEKRAVAVSAPAADGSFHFDWTMTFTATDAKVQFERTPIPGQPEGVAWGGYAGLTFRFARELKDWKAVNAEGVRDMEAHGKKSVGCDFSGVVDGKEVGLAMLDHPQNRNAPSSWYLGMDPKVPFGCLIAAPIFHQGFALDAGKSFTLRYRVVVHPARWDAARLKAEARQYAD